ncbi:MAG TPA: TRAP transporter substrate-binding protein [Nitrospirota bacterium]|nr:TRAP transporter substrate-binding protein [Nitrospirota bacterium]
MRAGIQKVSYMLIMIAACVFVTWNAGGTASADPIQISLSHTSSVESPWEKASLKFAEIINNGSNGKYKVSTFPNGVLVQKNWQIMIEMTQAGSNQIGVESITAFSSIVPEMANIQIPFLFNNDAHIAKFMATNPPILQKWLKKYEEKKLVVLALAPRKFRQLINNKRMVKTPQDIEGLKFRVPNNPMFVDIFTLLGAKPVPMSSGEIYSAIQLGTVVGEDNSISVVYDFKTHEVAKYMTIWNYIADGSMLLINKQLWDSMPPADKALFQKAAKEWVKVNRDIDETYQVKAIADMKKAGVIFYEMTDAEKVPFKKMIQPLYTKAKDRLGDADYNAFMKAVEAAKK